VVKFSSVVKSRVAQFGAASLLAVMSGTISADAGQTGLMQLAAVSDGFDAAAVYQQNCWACHNTGAAGAPKVGVPADWTPRLEKGFDTVVANAIAGLNGVMPAKGLCFTCSDDDIRALVQYMLDNSK